MAGGVKFGTEDERRGGAAGIKFTLGQDEEDDEPEVGAGEGWMERWMD